MNDLSHLRPKTTFPFSIIQLFDALRFRGLCSGAESGWDFTTRWMDDSHMAADLVGWQGSIHSIRLVIGKINHHDGNNMEISWNLYIILKHHETCSNCSGMLSSILFQSILTPFPGSFASDQLTWQGDEDLLDEARRLWDLWHLTQQEVRSHYSSLFYQSISISVCFSFTSHQEFQVTSVEKTV